MRDRTLELCAMRRLPTGSIDDAEVVPSHCSGLALLDDMQLWFDSFHLPIALVSRESVPSKDGIERLQCGLLVPPLGGSPLQTSEQTRRSFFVGPCVHDKAIILRAIRAEDWWSSGHWGWGPNRLEENRSHLNLLSGNALA